MDQKKRQVWSDNNDYDNFFSKTYFKSCPNSTTYDKTKWGEEWFLNFGKPSFETNQSGKLFEFIAQYMQVEIISNGKPSSPGYKSFSSDAAKTYGWYHKAKFIQSEVMQEPLDFSNPPLMGSALIHPVHVLDLIYNDPKKMRVFWVHLFQKYCDMNNVEGIFEPNTGSEQWDIEVLKLKQ